MSDRTRRTPAEAVQIIPDGRGRRSGSSCRSSRSPRSTSRTGSPAGPAELARVARQPRTAASSTWRCATTPPSPRRLAGAMSTTWYDTDRHARAGWRGSPPGSGSVPHLHRRPAPPAAGRQGVRHPGRPVRGPGHHRRGRRPRQRGVRPLRAALRRAGAGARRGHRRHRRRR